MPWKEVTQMSLRKEFIHLAVTDGCNFSKLCDRYKISRKTGYKWVHRFMEEGARGLEDRSRRPRNSPSRTSWGVEEKVIEIRQQHPTWGGRKIAFRLKALGMDQVPAPSTVTAILQRHGFIDSEESSKHKAFQRFEADQPNDLWQMDFKGHFEALEGRCHPLTMLDDHSRYALCLQACPDEKGTTVRENLRGIFRRYGIPKRILVDNGPPWGRNLGSPYTPLTLWLIRLGIGVVHSRVLHPQTLGKEERFHRTLKEEIQHECIGKTIEFCQERFDFWRDLYNLERPHDSLRMEVPASRYRTSPRNFPEALPPIEYAPGDLVRKVQPKGRFSFRNKVYKVNKAFSGEYVALRPRAEGVFDVFYCNQRIRELDLRHHNS